MRPSTQRLRIILYLFPFLQWTVPVHNSSRGGSLGSVHFLQNTCHRRVTGCVLCICVQVKPRITFSLQSPSAQHFLHFFFELCKGKPFLSKYSPSFCFFWGIFFWFLSCVYPRLYFRLFFLVMSSVLPSPPPFFPSKSLNFFALFILKILPKTSKQKIHKDVSTRDIFSKKTPIFFKKNGRHPNAHP